MKLNKTKLGLPAGILAAIMYLVGLFGGYLPALAVAGYILLCEEDNFVRRAAIKTFAVMLLCSLANTVIYLIPDLVGIFQSFFAIFRVVFGTAFLDNASSSLSQTLSLAKSAFLILMAVLAFFGKTIDLKPLNDWADK